MLRYFEEIGLTGKQLARRCGVSHSQIYMARKRNVGANNSEKISHRVALILGLSAQERLQLKAEIMGCPEDLVRAYFEPSRHIRELLDVPRKTVFELANEEKSIGHNSGVLALRRLREIGAPEVVIRSVEMRLTLPPERPRGRIALRAYGPEEAERRKTRESLEYGKPAVYEALRSRGTIDKEVRQQAGVGKETFSKALYGSVGSRSARLIARVLGEGLPANRIRDLKEQLMTPPEWNL